MGLASGFLCGRIAPGVYRMPYDFIFAGAGPAGLTGAICAARQGRRCLLIDKKQSLELHPRGETLRHRPILDEILGAGVMDGITIAATPHVEYFAPQPEKVEKIALQTKTPNLTFEWRDFMGAFERQLEPLDVDVVMEAEVVDLTKDDNGVVAGVVFRDAKGDRHSARAGAVFACDGHDSFIGRKLGVDYKYQNYPIVKSLFKRASFDSPAFKFFFLPAGCLDFAPDFPPAVAFLFPRDKTNCEVGFLVEARAADKLGCAMPGPGELLEVLGQVIKKHPVISNMLKGAVNEIMEVTMLPMGGPRENVIPAKGVVLLGDAAGFVETFGGSGLISSMESAKFWVNQLIELQAGSASPEPLWQDRTVQQLTAAYSSSGIYRHIKKIADYNNAAWNSLFVELRTSERIVENWQIIRAALDIY